MNILSRSYECKNDFWRMSEFLRQVFMLNQPGGSSAARGGA